MPRWRPPLAGGAPPPRICDDKCRCNATIRHCMQTECCMPHVRHRTASACSIACKSAWHLARCRHRAKTAPSHRGPTARRRRRPSPWPRRRRTARASAPPTGPASPTSGPTQPTHVPDAADPRTGCHGAGEVYGAETAGARRAGGTAAARSAQLGTQAERERSAGGERSAGPVRRCGSEAPGAESAPYHDASQRPGIADQQSRMNGGPSFNGRRLRPAARTPPG